MTTNFITWPYHLRSGHSDDPAEGACAMDAVNWLVHGKHGDHPECACPIISAYVIGGNDWMSDDTRQRLLIYLHRIAGSRSPEHESARLRILVLAAARVFAPIALEKAGFTAEAQRLRSLPDTASYKKIKTAAARAADAAARAAEDTYAAYAADAAYYAADAAARVNAANAEDILRFLLPWRKKDSQLSKSLLKAARAAADAARAGAARAGAYAADVVVNGWDEYFNILDEMLNAGP